MRYLKIIAFLLLPLVLMSLSGCGSGSSASSSASNPFNTGGGGSTTPGSTTTPVFTLTLGTDLTSVDANNGTVLANATLTSSTGGVITSGTGTPVNVEPGAQVPNWPVTFSILAGPATIDPALVTVNTDSKGFAETRITAGNTLITTNVLVQASTTINGQTITALTSFKVVRGTGIITFPGAPYSNEKTVDPTASGWIFFQQIPFIVTDSNGNPRAGVPVTLSVYSHASNATNLLGVPTSVITIDYLQNPGSEVNQQTVTTDSDGKGIFNVSVQVAAPGPGFNTVDSIVFKAVTNDTNPLVAYAGLITDLIEAVPPLVIAPQSANFAASDTIGTSISFTISGGMPQYKVVSSNDSRVSVTLQSDGVTAIAVLQDASLWTGSVLITAIDQKGQTATATVLRQ